MSYKILEQNGVTNENVDGAGFNYFASGKRDGILGGILSECVVYSPASNIVSIGTGVISVQGFRVKITSDISWAVSGNADEYSLVFEIVLNPDRSVSSQFIAQSSSLNLIKDDLLVTEKGTHQIEVIRFNWDGIAVSNISRRLPVIIAGSGSGGVSIELAQDVEGDSTEKAVSQKAVKDALGGKVDKVSKPSGVYVYTTEVNGQQTVRQSTNIPKAYVVPMTDANGNIKTNTPVEDLDVANKGFVEGIAAGKVDKDLTGKGRHRLYGVNGDTGAQKLYNVGHYNKPYEIPVYADATQGDVGKKDYGATFAVAMPRNPYQAANKKFVEDTVAPLQRDIRALNEAALGTLYTFEVSEFKNARNDLPNGVLANANVKYLGVVQLYILKENDEKIHVGTASLKTVRFLDASNNTINEFTPAQDLYFEIPEGATQMRLIEGDIEYFEGYDIHNYVIFDFVVEMQVKVGA